MIQRIDIRDVARRGRGTIAPATVASETFSHFPNFIVFDKPPKRTQLDDLCSYARRVRERL
jgi:hypothetical protein